jgi:nucleoside-diphosphate-sugar epimerase
VTMRQSSPSIAARSVLVTGAAGFIGSHLVEQLIVEGAKVRAFLRYNSRNERGWLDALDPEVQAQLQVVAGDLRHIESVVSAVAGTEIVFHLGAQIAIPYSCVNLRDFVDTNVTGTLNVAVAARDAGLERVVHTSRARSMAPRRRSRSGRRIRWSRSRPMRRASSRPTR